MSQMAGSKKEKLGVSCRKKIEKIALLKKKFNLSEGWEISEWHFWRNICLECRFPAKMILKFPTKQMRKIYGAKTVCQRNLTDSYVCSNFLFHRTWWVSLPLSVVCHMLSGPACVLQACPQGVQGPYLPGHTCFFRAQPWLMAPEKSLCSWLKSYPLEYQKVNYCIPLYPWDLCKVWIGQPSPVHQFFECPELQC